MSYNCFLFQLFSTVDLLSYIGGVLGLCLGFSAMSCLECMYFFTVRLGLNVRMNRDEPDVSGGLFDNHNTANVSPLKSIGKPYVAPGTP